MVRVHPENLDRQKLPQAAKTRRRLAAALSRDQRLGAVPDRERLPDREAVPEPLQGGAARSGSCGGSTFRTTTGSSPPPTSRERERWDDYQKAFSEMLSHTSTEWAPWYVIPADRKWFARIGAGAVLVHALMEIDPRFPTVTKAAARGADRGQGRRSRPRRPRARRRDPFEHEHEGTTARRERRPERARAGPGRSRRRPTRRHPSRAAPMAPQRDRSRPRPPAPDGWYGVSADDVGARLGVDPSVGLSSQKAAELLEQHGPNALPAEQPVPGWRRFARAVPQLHADDPGGRGDRVAGDQGVEHRRPAAPDHGAQRRRRACARRARRRAR